jgi:Ca2+-transporting ATPase
MEKKSQKVNNGFLEKPWKIKPENLWKDLNVDPDSGLNSEEIEPKRKKYGSNQIEKEERKSAISIFIKQFKSILVLLLTLASIISFIFGEIIEGIAISAVIIINAFIGFFTELRAARSMEALYELTKVKTKVRREGELKKIPADDLVVGDVVYLDAGDLVPADLRIIKCSKLQANESSLTGESIPIDKEVELIDNKDVPLAERRNMLYNP